MRIAAAALIVAGLIASPLGAEERRGRRGQGIPPGHLPPPGQCRVWYDGRPPGHQPAPASCRWAERVVSRDFHARVIYGGEPGRSGDRPWDRPGFRGDYPNRYLYPERRHSYPDRDWNEGR